MKQFTVFYDDGTSFSGNPLKQEWSKIDPTKKILRLEYIFDKIGIVMEGFRQYNHLIEFVAMGTKGINKIMLMGRTFDNTEVIVLNLKQNRVYKEYKEIYREYGKQILAGWQMGMMRTPKTYLKQIPNV